MTEAGNIVGHFMLTWPSPPVLRSYASDVYTVSGVKSDFLLRLMCSLTVHKLRSLTEHKLHNFQYIFSIHLYSPRY